MIRSVLIEIGGIIMKKNLSLLATLALAATLSPAAFAQQDQTAQPNPTDPQARSTPAPDTDTQAPKSFSGTVVKMEKQYVLKTDTATYQLDDQAKAKRFSGKQVTVNGTLDQSSSMIKVSDIQPAS
jgi:lipopolysaccharide export system protein LptA